LGETIPGTKETEKTENSNRRQTAAATWQITSHILQYIRHAASVTHMQQRRHHMTARF